MRITSVQENSKKHTYQPPDRILIIAVNSVFGDEVIGDAKVPYVGLQYVEKSALAFGESLPWYGRSGNVRYEVRRGRKVVCKGWLKGGPLKA